MSIERLHVHLQENGSVTVSPHPSVDGQVYATFYNVDIHDWRRTGGEADQAKWTARELDMAADAAYRRRPVEKEQLRRRPAEKEQRQE